MSKKNSITTCDYINFDEALNTGIRLMKEKKTELIGLYIIVSIYTPQSFQFLKCIQLKEYGYFDRAHKS